MSAIGDSLGTSLASLWKKEGLDAGEDSTHRNGGHGHYLVELIIVADSQLKMTGRNCLLLVLGSSVASQLEDLTSEVLEHSGSENACAQAYLVCVATLLKEAVSASNWEDQVAPGRVCLRLGSAISVLSCHLFSFLV